MGSADDGRRLVEQLTNEAKNLKFKRAEVFRLLSSAHEKKLHSDFVAALRILAGTGVDEMPDARIALLEVVDIGRGCADMRQQHIFQLVILSQVLDDAVIASELEDMYMAAE